MKTYTLVFLLGAAGRASARGVGGSHRAPRTDAVQAGQGLVGGPQSSHGWTLGRQWGGFRSREEGTFQGRDREGGWQVVSASVGSGAEEGPRMRTSWNMEHRTTILPASGQAGDVSRAGAAGVRGTRGVWHDELAGMY